MSTPNHDPRVTEYKQQFATASDALLAAIQTGITDGGEIVSHLLATVAANLGSTCAMTEGRSGSWEASRLTQFLASTVGEDGEYLMQYRTRPIEIVGCVDLAMVDLGVEHLYDESLCLIEDAEAEAMAANDEAAYERVDRAWKLIEALKAADYAAYRDEFERTVHEAAQKLVETRHLPPDVPVSVRWVEWQDRNDTTGSQSTSVITIEYELWETASTKTPARGFDGSATGLRPSLDRLQSEGRLPHSRIPELAHYALPDNRLGAE